MSETYERVRRQIMGHIVSQSIVAVCEAGVPDALADRARSAADLASELGVDADALSRFLRVLAAEGLFHVEGEAFALTDAGHLLRTSVDGSLHHLVKLMSGEAYQVWGSASHSLRTGTPAFDRVFGSPYFEWLADHPAAEEEFANAQAGLVELRLLPLLERDWSTAATVVDVGGGNGALVCRLLEHAPHLKGVVLDLPHIAEEAAQTPRTPDVASRLTVTAGSFFDGVPQQADVYVLSQILHDWPDDKALDILRNCRKAMSADGTLLIVEQVMPSEATHHPMALLDLHMLVLLGGRERTAEAWRDLLERAGFTLHSITPGPKSCLIEARPAAGGEA
ncbi:methyltransferase [Streptomyces sp. NPDC096339]|uniref:methyltransferase n=1 Tax=Streptomyces sp. NPDC096339 TaxID=3366086 RepID=UPI0038087BE7